MIFKILYAANLRAESKKIIYINCYIYFVKGFNK